MLIGAVVIVLGVFGLWFSLLFESERAEKMSLVLLYFALGYWLATSLWVVFW